jgi:hypothetical protein
MIDKTLFISVNIEPERLKLQRSILLACGRAHGENLGSGR